MPNLYFRSERPEQATAPRTQDLPRALLPMGRARCVQPSRLPMALSRFNLCYDSGNVASLLMCRDAKALQEKAAKKAQ